MAVEKASFDNLLDHVTKASRIAFEETLDHFNETFAQVLQNHHQAETERKRSEN